MTVLALLAEPPVPGVALADLADAGRCSQAAAADVYGAMVQDAVATVARSGGELLVNHPPAEDYDGDVDPEAALRELVEPVLGDAAEARFEVQVGSTESARVGNTITHLLEGEDADTAAILRPEAPLVGRGIIDGAAMKLRSDPVVLGPAPRGRVYYAGFAETIDFEDALAAPTVQTLTDHAVDAGLSVNFEAMHPLVQTAADLADFLPVLRARERTEALVPETTAAAVAEYGLQAE